MKKSELLNSLLSSLYAKSDKELIEELNTLILKDLEKNVRDIIL